MNWFPSVWELDSEQVIQRQIKSEKEEKSFLDSKSDINDEMEMVDHSFEESNAMTKDKILSEQIQFPKFNDFASKEVIKKDDKILYNSWEMATILKNRNELSMQNVSVEKENINEADQEETKGNSLEKSAPRVNFESRCRFTKRHDRGTSLI